MVERESNNFTQKDLMQHLLHAAQHAATREEVHGVKIELKAEIGEVRAEVRDLRTELKAEIGEVRAEVRDLRTELKAEIGEVRAEVRDLRTELKDEIALCVKHTDLKALESRLLIKLTSVMAAMLTISIGAASFIFTYI